MDAALVKREVEELLSRLVMPDSSPSTLPADYFGEHERVKKRIVSYGWPAMRVLADHAADARPHYRGMGVANEWGTEPVTITIGGVCEYLLYEMIRSEGDPVHGI